MLARLWQWSQEGVAERRATKERARFWAELREGEREAEAQCHPGTGDSAKTAADFPSAKIAARSGNGESQP